MAYYMSETGAEKADALNAAAKAAEMPIVYPTLPDGTDLPITAETLHRWLTVTISTSPVTSHPSTAMLEEVVRSMSAVPLLSALSKLIVCDGVKVKQKNKFRSGEVTEERAEAYESYKTELKRLAQTRGSVLEGARVLELEERCGFGYAMREAVPFVTTPFVIVVQHDRAFLRGDEAWFQHRYNVEKGGGSAERDGGGGGKKGAHNGGGDESGGGRGFGSRSESEHARGQGAGSVDLLSVVRGMRRHRAWLHYVGLATSRTLRHATIVLSKYKTRLATVTADVSSPLRGEEEENEVLLVATKDGSHAKVIQDLANDDYDAKEAENEEEDNAGAATRRVDGRLWDGRTAAAAAEASPQPSSAGNGRKKFKAATRVVTVSAPQPPSSPSSALSPPPSSPLLLEVGALPLSVAATTEGADEVVHNTSSSSSTTSSNNGSNGSSSSSSRPRVEDDGGVVKHEKEAEAMAAGEGRPCLRLVPLVQWYDSTHVASTEYYRRFVFCRKAKRVAKGGFIEDKLGQEQLRLTLERGMCAHGPYGTFILVDGSGGPVVSHLDGHDPRASAKFVHI